MKTIQQAEDWAHAQISKPSQSWKSQCQSFVRQAYGVGSWAPSAYDAWLKIPSKQRHFSVIEDAPRGAAIYFKHRVGDPRPGHVVIATEHNCLSNDIYRSGEIDVAPRDIFISKWNMEYLGWSLWTPFGVIGE